MWVIASHLLDSVDWAVLFIYMSFLMYVNLLIAELHNIKLFSPLILGGGLSKAFLSLFCAPGRRSDYSWVNDLSIAYGRMKYSQCWCQAFC